MKDVAGFLRFRPSLIIETSTDLPPDVRAAMRVAMNEEPEGTRAAQALTIIGQNIYQATEGKVAICQDTGMLTFEVKTPVGTNQDLDEAADQRRRRRSHQQPRTPARRSSTSSNGDGCTSAVCARGRRPVYLNVIGGAAQFYARCIDRVDDVSLLELGTPEAIWHLQLRDFPAIVTMDAHGNSLHLDVEAESGERL